ADMVYLGGGHPELYAGQISANTDFIEGVHNMSDEGKPVYGECGGLMTMCDSIRLKDGSVHRMCGIFHGESVFTGVRHGPAYVVAEPIGGNPFFKDTVKGHEYHYSDVYPAGNPSYGFRNSRGTGISDGYDGLYVKKSLGSYMHQHALSMDDWAAGFRESLV
ncbi:MAG: hydrogenobyrinic acid a,c-diamide synthase (glutamine-hydrolyzing), partial [Candidatus Methanomethylophilaceae archaeon]|nr:hydrogenobyrinic acid a,c-diamide synthase (glutamine-hydrolyzing) [Candidatus Methanomethylophilaceae archaeon]